MMSRNIHSVLPFVVSLSLAMPALLIGASHDAQSVWAVRTTAGAGAHESGAAPAPLVVSDAMRAYLESAERQRDQALQKSFRPEPANDRRSHLASEILNRAH